MKHTLTTLQQTAPPKNRHKKEGQKKCDGTWKVKKKPKISKSIGFNLTSTDWRVGLSEYMGYFLLETNTSFFFVKKIVFLDFFTKKNTIFRLYWEES